MAKSNSVRNGRSTFLVQSAIEERKMSELEQQLHMSDPVGITTGPLLVLTEQDSDRRIVCRLTAEQLRAAASVLAYVHAHRNSAVALAQRES